MAQVPEVASSSTPPPRESAPSSLLLKRCVQPVTYGPGHDPALATTGMGNRPDLGETGLGLGIWIRESVRLDSFCHGKVNFKVMNTVLLAKLGHMDAKTSIGSPRARKTKTQIDTV